MTMRFSERKTMSFGKALFGNTIVGLFLGLILYIGSVLGISFLTWNLDAGRFIATSWGAWRLIGIVITWYVWWVQLSYDRWEWDASVTKEQCRAKVKS